VVGGLLTLFALIGWADDPSHPVSAVAVAAVGALLLTWGSLVQPRAQRRRTLKEVSDRIKDVLQPGENVLASAASYINTVDSSQQIDLGETVRRFRSELKAPTLAKPSFVLVTNKRLLYLRRDQGFQITFAEPRSEISVVEVRSGPGWIEMSIRQPDGSLVLLNFKKPWLTDGAAVRDALADRSIVKPG
jgi:hypothetical protein